MIVPVIMVADGAHSAEMAASTSSLAARRAASWPPRAEESGEDQEHDQARDGDHQVGDACCCKESAKATPSPVPMTTR